MNIVAAAWARSRRLRIIEVEVRGYQQAAVQAFSDPQHQSTERITHGVSSGSDERPVLILAA